MTAHGRLKVLGLLLWAPTFLGCFCNPPVKPDAGPDVTEDAGPDGGEDAGVDAGPGPCKKHEDCDPTQRCDLQTGKCIPACRRDDDCEALDRGLRCNEATGICIQARGCNDDTNCQELSNADDYCYYYGIQCRCITESNDGGFPGVCRRRRSVCDECTHDSQCGTGAVFDPVGRCLALQGDTSGKKYCFQSPPGGGSCGCGMKNQNGYCVPQSNDCSSVGCKLDKDCPTGSVCNTASCLCEPRCRWDFANKQEAHPGCPPGRVCWVDNDNLDPSSLYYGAGRCRPPCNNSVECTDTQVNPYGGARLKCAGEKLAGGGLSPKRCRANGDCMDNLECPDQPPQSIYLGYCDRGAFTCNTDCRVGVDPVTGQSYKDCRTGYKCEGRDAGNECVMQTCVELGGARIACRRGQFCCGEDKNGDGLADPCPPVSQREPDNCYDAPSPPFCTQCSSPADCVNYNPPGWLTPCANGSKSPSCSPLPNLCVYAGNRGQAQGINICAPSTWNDPTKDSFGVGKDVRGCPAGYAATQIRPKFTAGNDPDFCKTNADCSLGNDAGLCDVDLTVTLQDGGHPLACLCTQPGLVSNCPNSADGGGITSVCRFGIAIPSVCLQSVVCTPSPGLAYRDAGPPDYGCGL